MQNLTPSLAGSIQTSHEREQSRGEELANSISHGAGLVAAIVATPFLILHAVQIGNARYLVGASIFAATMVLLYLASTLYHALPPGRAKRVFRIIEHSTIFLLIAGTYTPFTLVTLRGPLALLLLGLGAFFVLFYTWPLKYIALGELGELMDLATVVVYPYRSSTQSGALQVAYTFGRPVIATAVGGLPEAVEDGRNGYLVPPGSPSALAEKISVLLENPSIATRMGEYARHLSQTRFSWDAVATQIRDVYEDLAKNSIFDGIVFGELSPAKWMAGSDFHRRTDRRQDAWPAETAGPACARMPIAPSQDVTIVQDVNSMNL